MTNNTWQSHLDETKRGLARLLARENLIVRHADVPTASFDLERRTLTLPKWSDITVDQYDLLIGHEVGHALYSDDVQAVKDALQYPGLHTYINVLEDVRIERRIKDEFPGLRGAFTRGYRDFYEKGPIFQLEKPVDQYDFIDRINIHYKIGAHVTVPFSDDERLILARLDRCRTMQEIVALARELWNGQKAKNEEQSGTGGSPQGTPQQGIPSGDAAEGGDQTTDSDRTPSEDGEDAEDAEGSGNTDAEDAEEGAASTGNQTDAPPTDPMAETDKQNADAMTRIAREEMSDTSVDHVLLAPVSDDMLKRCTLNNETFVNDGMRYLNSSAARFRAAETYLQEFQSKYGPTVAHMAREFERRKTAKLHERARVARTGRLDMSKLASYKFREDLFQQVMVVPNGKSHGIVLLIDGSGSMASVFGDVIEQVMLFTQFAQRVNIPVQAFMFNDRMGYDDRLAFDATPDYVARPQHVSLVCLYDSTRKQHKPQQMVLAAVACQCSERRDRRVPDRVGLNMPHISLGSTPLRGSMLVVERHVAKLKASLRLEKMSLIVLTDGDATDAIIYNRPADAGGRYRYVAVYRDTITRRVYADIKEETGWNKRVVSYQMDNSVDAMLVDSIRRRHDARVVRIFITPQSAPRRASESRGFWDLIRHSMNPRVAETVDNPNTVNIDALFTANYHASSVESFKQNGQMTIAHPNCYYDALILVTSNTLDLDEDDFETQETHGWSARKIASAFTKANVNATKNRVFVNSVVPFLA